jgi:hypothetical protein
MQLLHTHIQKIISIRKKIKTIMSYFEEVNCKKCQQIIRGGEKFKYEYFVTSICLNTFLK